MTFSVPIDVRDVSVTPIFKHISVEDVPASEREGHLVMETIEVVEVRFAGHKLYSPMFPAMAVWIREGGKAITYAERWKDQYRAFLEGDVQRASGTPLEMLKPFGISDAQLSLCRVMKIYSIEALDRLEGAELKSLQMHGNELKRMARAYISSRHDPAADNAKIAALEAQIEALRKAIPVNDPTPAEQDEALTEADTEALRQEYKALTGSFPRGTPKPETLARMVQEARKISA